MLFDEAVARNLRTGIFRLEEDSNDAFMVLIKEFELVDEPISLPKAIVYLFFCHLIFGIKRMVVESDYFIVFLSKALFELGEWKANNKLQLKISKCKQFVLSG